jgi:hypothetical protein
LVWAGPCPRALTTPPWRRPLPQAADPAGRDRPGPRLELCPPRAPPPVGDSHAASAGRHAPPGAGAFDLVSHRGPRFVLGLGGRVSVTGRGGPT